MTRILSLHGFPPELKTRDIQAAFAEYENERGGFKIKWIDDTSLLIVFNDAAVAKRAYLTTLVNPPPQFTSPTSDSAACLRPYDGPDAQNVIAAVNSRATGHRARASISASSSNVLAGLVQVGGAASGVSALALPTVSTSTSSNTHARTGSRTWKKPIGIDTAYSINGQQQSAGSAGGISLSSTSPLAREPSPSLPSLPSHPTLGSLISSSLTDLSSHDTSIVS